MTMVENVVNGVERIAKDEKGNYGHAHHCQFLFFGFDIFRNIWHCSFGSDAIPFIVASQFPHLK